MREIQEKKARLNLGKARAVIAPLNTTQRTSLVLIVMNPSLITIARAFSSDRTAEKDRWCGSNGLKIQATQRRQIK
jgi:hypothetical protein